MVFGVEGEMLILVCQASGVPEPQIRWYHNEREIRPTGRVSMDRDSSLVISNSELSDAGEYVCQADNGIGSLQSRTIEVSIYGKGS